MEKGWVELRSKTMTKRKKNKLSCEWRRENRDREEKRKGEKGGKKRREKC